MAKPPGLRQRGGSWGMRVRVPDRLRSILPTEIVKSLGRVSAKEAYRLGWIERAAIERLFEQAEVDLGLAKAVLPPLAPAQSILSEEQLIDFAKQFLHDLETSSPAIPLREEEQEDLRDALIDDAYHLGQPNAVEDATMQSVAKAFAEKIGFNLPEGIALIQFVEAIREGWLEYTGRQLSRLGGATVAKVNPAFLDVDANSGLEHPRLTLAEAIDAYIAAPCRSTNVKSTQKMDRARLGILKELFGPAKQVASITKSDIRSYVEHLMQLPANANQRFPGMTAQQAIHAGNEAKSATLSPASVRRHLEATKSFFKWLVGQDFISKNPALNIDGPKVSKKSKRRPFTPVEMNKLLRATSAEGPHGEAGWMYWCTRISMLQGFRLTEPLGLQVKDLVQKGDIWAFDLKPNEIRTLKTEETARVVPIHPKLIDLGILGLLQDRSPDELLIPGVPRGDGKSLNAAQQQLARLIRKHVSADPTLVFHSLRHSFRDAMRNAELPTSIEEKLGGWKITNNSTMDGYGSGHKLEVLLRGISKIGFEGVEIN